MLGAPFSKLTLPLGEDDEGPVVATLVRALAAHSTLDRLFGDRRPLHDVDVLYLHGWSDYFFQRSLAQYWIDRGADFYALDLRKYGRSIRPGQTPGYITHLSTYDEEIDAALAAMDRPLDGPPIERRLVLIGHSTGGLILSLWASDHPAAAAAVILNSPWLEFQLRAVTRAAVAPLVDLRARLRPLDTLPQVDLGYYSRAQREVRADPGRHQPAVAPRSDDARPRRMAGCDPRRPSTASRADCTSTLRSACSSPRSRSRQPAGRRS